MVRSKDTKEQLDNKIGKLEIQVTKNTKSIEKNTESIGNLANQAVKNTEVIKQMLTREEFHETMREVLDGQDKSMTILKRLDEERIFANIRLDRLEEKVLQ